MPARLVNIDRQTPMFLPCDLRQWVPSDHIVHFILDAVEQIPTAHFHVNDCRGRREQGTKRAFGKWIRILVCMAASVQ